MAAFVAGLRAGDLPPDVAGRVKLLILDAFASAMAGRAMADRVTVEAVAQRLAGAGDSTVIGGQGRSLVGATFVNAYQTTAATVCDVHRPTLCHVTPEVVAPALAVAESRATDGATVLAAVAAGLETTVRVGLALDYPRFRARGWHSPGVTGPFGGAVAVARLLGLDALGVRHALGHAGSQAAGTFAALGTSAVKMHQARGAVSGLLAGLLAAEGFDAAPRILTAADGGLLTTYADGGEPAALLDGLGRTWRLEDISLRRWPAASSLQALVGGLLELLKDADPGADDVAGLRVGVTETAFQMHARAGWEDQLAALQSIRYVAAVVLRDRRCWLEQYAPEHLRDAALDAFAREHVQVSIDPTLPPGGATVSLLRRDGAVEAIRVEVPKGDPRQPLTVAEVEAKFLDATAGTGLADRARSIMTMVGDLEDLESVGHLARALRGSTGTPQRRARRA
ncbi:MAG: MmgE/PrpD family protein [Candidatus Limnocylindrales bacterium]